jgi:hypothetical protein
MEVYMRISVMVALAIMLAGCSARLDTLTDRHAAASTPESRAAEARLRREFPGLRSDAQVLRDLAAAARARETPTKPVVLAKAQ